MCSTFSKFLFINLLYCNILLSQQKKKEIGFVKEYLVILESLGKLLKKKKKIRDSGMVNVRFRECK